MLKIKDFYPLLRISEDTTDNSVPNIKNTIFSKSVRDTGGAGSENAIAAYYRGRLDLYQMFCSHQGGDYSKKIRKKLLDFGECNSFFFAFVPYKDNFILAQCYRIVREITMQDAIHSQYITDEYKRTVEPISQSASFFMLERLDDVPLEGRLYMNFKGTGQASNLVNSKIYGEKEVFAVLPEESPVVFESYEKILLSYSDLCEVINSDVWKQKLSLCAGIYLISDKKTGKQYVGSAYGDSGGIFGRWKQYSTNPTGGNKLLTALCEAEGVQYLMDNFQWSILEILPLKKGNEEVLAYERLWKNKLGTRATGLNGN